jgi:hypothetical protein
MKVWIFSSGIDGVTSDTPVTDIMKGDGLKVYASRAGAEAALDTLLLAMFNGDWRTVVSDDGFVFVEGTLNAPVGSSTTGWAGIALQDVIEDELPSRAAKGDSVVLHDEKTGRTEDGWTVVYVSSRGAKVSIAKKDTMKHLDRLSDGRWHHVGDVYATFGDPTT